MSTVVDQMRRPRRTLRSVGAVLAGFLAIVILSVLTDTLLHATGVFPPVGQPMSDALFLLATAYRFLYGVVAGYITGRLAPDRPMGHAMALGVVGLVVSIAGTVATWNKGPEFGPTWYPLTIVAIVLPSVWAGAKVRGMKS